MDVWDTAGADFVEHYGRLYGRVRTHVVREHLRTHLAPVPATVVDVGGGDGQDGLGLAREGYDVTIVEPSPAMRARASDRVAGETADTRARVRIVDSDGEHALQRLGETRFDAVLCHGVLAYLDDPEPVVATLGALAKPGGVVSVLTKNARTLALRPALERDWTAALAAFDATSEVNRLGLVTHGTTPERLAEVLARHGVDMVAWYGVRVFTEGWGRDEPAADPEGAVLAVELEASRRDPYRGLSRLLHLVGVRR